MRGFERPARELAALAVCTALLFAGQAAMAALPNIEPVTLLLLLYTLFFGRKTLLILYAFVLLEGFLYGFHIWWFIYLYIWLVWYLAVAALKKFRPTPFQWALAAGAFGLLFGALGALAYIPLSGPAGAFGWWVAGIPMDLLHGGGNFVLTLVLLPPLSKVMERLV